MPFLYIVVWWGGRGVEGGGVSKSEFLWFSNGHILLLLHFLAVVLIVIIVGVEFIRIYSNIFIVEYRPQECKAWNKGSSGTVSGSSSLS